MSGKDEIQTGKIGEFSQREKIYDHKGFLIEQESLRRHNK